MARPRRSEQTREALINEGIEQISRHGYHGTGIKQILDVVNVPKGSFYNFFESKEAFVAELIKEYSKNLLAELNGFRDGPGADLTPVEKLRSIYQYGLQMYSNTDCQKSCLIGALAMDIGSESASCQQALRKATEEWQAVFSQVLTAAQQAGEVREDLNAMQLSSVYWSTWEGALMKMKVTGDSDEAAQTMEIMLTILFKAP
ncbi:MAG: TetR family transcriptional regulator C-terminal domain-containing protein [Bermanella sp.]